MVTYAETNIKKSIVYFTSPTIIEKGLLDTYEPSTVESVNYKNRRAILDLRSCLKCRSLHGKIYKINDIVFDEPPLHAHCRCKIKPMESIYAGEATKDGDAGADFWLKYFGKLPDYYVTESEAHANGWKRGEISGKIYSGENDNKGYLF